MSQSDNVTRCPIGNEGDSIPEFNRDGRIIESKKIRCFGCGACVQACSSGALDLRFDEEKFRYPVFDGDKCKGCGRCISACPSGRSLFLMGEQRAWGGYHLDDEVREASTSGGAYTALIEEWFLTPGSFVFGAKLESGKPTSVVHSCATDLAQALSFRKSKYIQSDTGNTFREVCAYLKAGKRVLYSGTPCQIAGLRQYLKGASVKVLDAIAEGRLLTVEVVCEGVPSPLFAEKEFDYVGRKHGGRVAAVDWRDTHDRHWDFQFMRYELTFDGCDGRSDATKSICKARWLNPFWSIWLQHLISRPSCYECPYARRERVADISIADLWGVHLYCPELYGRNGGTSLVVCNSLLGARVWDSARERMHGHELDIDDAVRYQSPMRSHIAPNPKRDECMRELIDPDKPYEAICSKWAVKPSVRLLFQKYVWGNRQKVAFWNLRQKMAGRKRS